MRKSHNTDVQKFLDELKAFDIEKYKIVTVAREIVLNQHPLVSERIIYGGIMFTLKKDFGGLFVSKHHVSFEFSEGASLTDHEGLLEGGGTFRRHLKLRKKVDVQDKKVASFVGQIID